MSNLKQDNEIEEKQDFSLSISDLMSAMLFIFILLLSGAMLQLKEKEERLAQISSDYQNVKDSIFDGLEQEFKNNIEKWHIELIDSSLCVRFQDTNVLFDNNSSELKKDFKEILDSFFVRYINLIYKDNFKEHIREIRIEGHTSSLGDYFENMALSQQRTLSVLNYCYNLIDDELQKEWMLKRITANGMSESHVINNSDGTENDTLSRRVEFIIVTDAEKQMEMIKNRIFEN